MKEQVEQIVVNGIKRNLAANLTKMLMIMRWTPNQIDKLVDELNQKTSDNKKYKPIETKTFFDILEKNLGHKIARNKPIEEKLQQAILRDMSIQVMEQTALELRNSLQFEKYQGQE